MHTPPQPPTLLASINTPGWKPFYVAINLGFFLVVALGLDHGYDNHPHWRVAAIVVNAISLIGNGGWLLCNLNSRAS